MHIGVGTHAIIICVEIRKQLSRVESVFPLLVLMMRFRLSGLRNKPFYSLNNLASLTIYF